MNRSSIATLATLTALSMFACGGETQSPSAAPDVGADADLGPEDLGRDAEEDGPELDTDTTTDPDLAPDVPDELECPEGTRHLEVECVPEAFFRTDGGALEACVDVLAPVAEEPDCTRDCRGAQLPGLLWNTGASVEVYAPVAGTVTGVANGWPGREAAEDCYEVDGKGACCGLDAAEGNFVTIKDRKNRLWTLSHLAPGVTVATGDVVRAGQAVGMSGDSGYVCGEGARVYFAARLANNVMDIAECVVGAGAGAEPPDCRDRDLDTYGVGPDCDAQDCNDDNGAWQSFDETRRGCLAATLDGQACADRDGDGAFAGGACPWPDEDCNDFDFDVQSGCTPNTCACDDGPCCDGCDFLSAQATCDAEVDERFVCHEGTDCGSDVFSQLQVRRCSGEAALCDGELVWEAPQVAQACSRDAVCGEGLPECVPDEVCATLCDGDGDCGEDQFCREGVCTGDVCDAGERFCAGMELRLCADNGGGSSLLDACNIGCENGTCLGCPQNVCEDLDLGEGAHCVEDTRVVCAEVDGCRAPAEEMTCLAPMDICAEGACVECVEAADCPSPRQDCAEGVCVCRHGCEEQESGCNDELSEWSCQEDVGGCRQPVIEACPDQHACSDGACERVCAPNYCQDNALQEGAHCDGRARVLCGADDICGVESERENCRGDTRYCLEGDCVECLEDQQCPSPRQTCEAGSCICRDTCQDEDVGCLNDETAWTCAVDEGACRYMETSACDDGFICAEGACIRDCADNACQRAQQGEGMLCDGDRRVHCREVDGCYLERFWQDCGCGCADGVCAPCDEDGPLLVLGTGENGYDVTNDGDVVALYAGFQGGHHVFGAFRLYGAEQLTNTVQRWRILEGEEELAIWDTFGNLEQHDGYSEFYGETVMFFLGTPPESLDGRNVRLTLTLEVDGTTVHDERDITLQWPP